jgi:peptidoglycan/xylan/chitin deacetylase (PgdA/CDA1 family)
MHEIARKLDELVDRAANRLIWKFGGKPKLVRTDTPIVSFTFDDVPDSALFAGASILEKHGVFGTFYIAGGLAGRAEPARRLISPDGCRELAVRGHEIGCHTFSHERVRDYSGRSLARDLDRNAAYLKEAAGAERVKNFAFPYNAAWPMARGELRRRFRTCRAGGEAINRGAVDPMMLKGVAIGQPEEAARSLTCWIDELANEPGWLVFFTHDIAERPTPYGCTPQTFEMLVRYSVEAGCAVLRVDQALERLGW